MTLLAESDVESAALAWLEALGWAVKHGDEIAPDGTSTERRDFSQVVLERRLRAALAALNPGRPSHHSTGRDGYFHRRRSLPSRPLHPLGRIPG